MSAPTTRVFVGQYEEQGTHCKHCGITYRQCTIDVLREPHDPKANNGCCDQCDDASGHEVSAIPDPARAALREIRLMLLNPATDFDDIVDPLLKMVDRGLEASR